MKILAFLLLFSSLTVEAANVTGAKIDSSGNNILVDVVYGGGCAIHHFSLKLGFCARGRDHLKCSAYLHEEIEGGVDMCEAIRNETAVINIKENGLEEYRGSKFTIYGDRSFNGTQTSVEVWIPRKN
ncbi:MAG: hypothetical protein ACLGHN_15050 [Bacteriovoracia bacterium]